MGAPSDWHYRDHQYVFLLRAGIVKVLMEFEKLYNGGVIDLLSKTERE